MSPWDSPAERMALLLTPGNLAEGCALRLFWCFDPDGNRVNIWSYPHAGAQYEEQQRKCGAERTVWVR